MAVQDWIDGEKFECTKCGDGYDDFDDYFEHVTICDGGGEDAIKPIR